MRIYELKNLDTNFTDKQNWNPPEMEEIEML
jgi:hypothetical protein